MSLGHKPRGISDRYSLARRARGTHPGGQLQHQCIVNLRTTVTLHEIVRMRRFTHSAAAYLRIILGKIIEYAAITITPPTAGTPSIADVNSLKRLGFRQPCGAISLAKGRGLTKFDAGNAFQFSNKVQ